MQLTALLLISILGVAFGQDECGDHVMCAMACPFGFLKDHKGCNTCSCLPEQCQNVECAPDKNCRVTELTADATTVTVCADPRLPAVCQLAKDIGPCKAKEPRWYHDADTDACTSFDFGGCQGNENNFESEEDCNNLCQPVEEGSCSPAASCHMACPDGFKVDDRGCDLCECKDPAPIPEGEPTPCPKFMPMCMMHCPHGFRLGEDGCQICDCAPEGEHPEHRHRCSSVTCHMACPDGFKKDADGCSLCECMDKPVCPEIACDMNCSLGFRRGEDGCDICECRTEQECHGIQCRMLCPYGFKKDEYGCNLCFCNEDPCKDNECEHEACLARKTDKGEYEAVCLADHFDRSKRPWCDDTIMCAMECPHGFQSDQNGCPVCACVDHDVTCPAPSKCQPPCYFGYLHDKEGCRTCDCKEDPCTGGNGCGDDEVCEAFKEEPMYPAEARCLEVKEVKRVHIQITFVHEEVEDLDKEEFAEEFVDKISEKLEVDEAHIVGVGVQPVDSTTTNVHFHVLTTEEFNAVDKYEELKENIEDDTFIEVSGTAFTPQGDKMTASYSSQSEFSDDDHGDSDSDEFLTTQNIIILTAIVAGCIIVIAVIVIVKVVKRSGSKHKSDRNVNYSKTPQSESARVQHA